MAKQLVEGAPRRDVFMVNPESLVIVGWDIPAAGHALADPRAKWPVKEELVVSIMDLGVLEPIGIRKDEQDRILVVYGKQRTKAAREASKRLNEVGKSGVLVPCIGVPRGMSEAQMKRMIGAENAQRTNNGPIEDAQWAADYLKTQGDTAETWAEIIATLGISKARVEQILRVLEDPKLVKAVQTGKASIETVVKLQKLPAADRKVELDKAEESGTKTTTTQARAALRKSKGLEPVPTTGERRECLKAIATMDPKAIAKVNPVDVLRWTLGEAPCPFFLGAEPKPDRFRTTVARR